MSKFWKFLVTQICSVALVPRSSDFAVALLRHSFANVAQACFSVSQFLLAPDLCQSITQATQSSFESHQKLKLSSFFAFFHAATAIEAELQCSVWKAMELGSFLVMLEW